MPYSDRLLLWIIPSLILILILITTAAIGKEVPHVLNSATPRDGIQTVELEELWRVGTDEDGLIFGRVPRVDTDSSGNIYILDAQLCQVHVFSPAGELVRTVFGEGEGPAEVRGPRDMLLMPNGNIGLVLESLGIVKFVDAQGDPAGSFRFGGLDGGNQALVSGVGLNGAVVLAGRTSRPGETRSIRKRRNFLVSSDLTGQEMATYTENFWVRNFADLTYVENNEMPPFNWVFDVGLDGRIYAVIDRDEYAISVFAPDGTAELVIKKKYTPLRRSQKDRDQFTHMIATSMQGMPFETKVEMQDNYPAISILHRGLQIAPDGTLWVLSGRGMQPETPGTMAIFDVFDSAGVFIQQVVMNAPFAADRVGIVLADNNRVIVVAGYLESIASQFGNGATFSGEEWYTPEVIVYEMKYSK